MISILMNYPHKPGISIDKYFRDRAILAGRHASKFGRWNITWASAQLRWHAHCIRARDADMWHQFILKHRAETWLAAQRQQHGHGNISRTRTRLRAGHVASRWLECLQQARTVAPAWSTDEQQVFSIRLILAALLAD